MRIQAALVFACLLAGSGLVWADSSTTSPATTGPAATQLIAIHKAVIPPGFHSIMVSGQAIFCQPSDDDWVRDALAKLEPATRPTTLPSDLTATVQQRRDSITKEIMQELALSDPKPINELFDLKLLPILKRLTDLHPTVYYLAASRPRVVDLLKNGWSDPRYHYLRFDNSLSYNNSVNLSIDQQTDNLIMWAEIHDDAPEDRGRVLRYTINDFNGGFLHTLSTLSQLGTRNEFEDLVHTRATNPLKLPPGLQWFGHAVDIVYAIKYESELTGNSRGAQMDILLAGNPSNPLHPQPLNLLQPIDPATMRPEYLPVYNDAVIHKGAGVIAAWIAKGGDGVLAKALPALRATPPATPADLVKIIQQSTGIDVSPAMLPNFKDAPPQL